MSRYSLTRDRAMLKKNSNKQFLHFTKIFSKPVFPRDVEIPDCLGKAQGLTLYKMLPGLNEPDEEAF